MRFFLINSYSKDFAAYFQKACQKLGFEYNELDFRTINYAKLPKLKRNDCLYRTEIGRAATLEKLLINKSVASLYADWRCAFIDRSALMMAKNNIPMPKTIFGSSNNKELLKKYVKYLGGLPIVVKVPGKYGGVGVIKAETFASLFSIIDYLASKNEYFLLREYIHSPGLSYRSIILGEKALCTYKNQSLNPQDFRSNADQTKRKRSQVKLKPHEEKDLVNAVKSLGLEFGGVDFAYEGKYLKIFEINFPCNFEPAQKEFKIDITSEILRHLKAKLLLRRNKS